MDATALAASIAGGQTTARAAMEAALAAAERHAGLGAIVRVAAGPALAQATADEAVSPTARGPFHGVPFLGKDLGSGARGLPTGAGSPALRRRVAEAAGDSDLFRRFRSAGLRPFGLTAVPEFGLSLSTEPPGAPPARNPWDPDLTPGGSSGGAAAAVAAGIVAVAHATDAAGSIRVPAACCGLGGLKPSRGAVPGGPDFGNHLMGLAGELVLARSVWDVTAAFLAVAGGAAGSRVPFSGDPRVALAIPLRCGSDQTAACRAAAEALARSGCEIVEGEAPDRFGAEAAALARVVLSVSLAEWLDSLAIGPGEVTPLAAAVAAEGRALPGTVVFAATREVARLSHRALALFAQAQAVLMPVLSGPPPRVGGFDPEPTIPSARFAAMEALAPNATLANVAGLPALALPFGMAGGLPLGVQILGPIGCDLALLALGARLEALAPPLAYPHPIAGLP